MKNKQGLHAQVKRATLRMQHYTSATLTAHCVRDPLFWRPAMHLVKHLALLALLASAAASAQADTNVALDKPVTLIGAFATGSAYLGDPAGVPHPGGYPSAPASIVTDGIFQAGSWLSGVWWDEQNSGVHNYVVVELGGLFSLTGFSVMADENDRYLLEARDQQGTWTPVWEIPESFQGGLSLRSTVLGSAVEAVALRLQAIYVPTAGHDYAYSVSEIQAFGVPEPSAWALLAAGLVLLHRRFRRTKGF